MTIKNAPLGLKTSQYTHVRMHMHCRLMSTHVQWQQIANTFVCAYLRRIAHGRRRFLIRNFGRDLINHGSVKVKGWEWVLLHVYTGGRTHRHTHAHTQRQGEGKAKPLVIHEFMSVWDLELQLGIRIVCLCVFIPCGSSGALQSFSTTSLMICKCAW